MKKLLVLIGSVLMSGCFICHKTAPQEKNIENKEIAAQQQSPVQQSPVKEDNVISRHSISEVANFDFNSKEIRPDMNKMDVLKKDIKAHPDAVIWVEGHTDNVGTDEYNKNLSLQRAQAVAEELSKQNYPNEIHVYGAGATSPIASNDTEEGRAQNRRVDVILAKDEKK